MLSVFNLCYAASDLLLLILWGIYLVLLEPGRFVSQDRF